MAVTHTYYLKFKTDTNESATITIPHADASLDGTAVRAGMQSVIDTGIVYTDNGNPTGIIGADLLTKETVDVVFA